MLIHCTHLHILLLETKVLGVLVCLTTYITTLINAWLRQKIKCECYEDFSIIECVILLALCYFSGSLTVTCFETLKLLYIFRHFEEPEQLTLETQTWPCVLSTNLEPFSRNSSLRATEVTGMGKTQSTLQVMEPSCL